MGEHILRTLGFKSCVGSEEKSGISGPVGKGYSNQECEKKQRIIVRLLNGCIGFLSHL